jgi:hypothetical protein
VDLVAAVVADEQPLELVQPREGTLDDPAVAAEPRAVLGLAACNFGFDPAAMELASVLVVVVASIGGDPLGALPRPADLAAHRRHPLDERDQLSDVVAIAARDRPGERDSGRIDEEMLLRPVSGSINRARARLGAPFFACTWLESAIARDHSISPAARKRASSNSCSRFHTPARCHSSIRRQHVTPEPKPSSSGRCVHEIPVCSTNKIPCNACRSGNRFRPGWRKRRSFTGNSGSTNSHNSSGTIHGATAIGPSKLDDGCRRLRRQGPGPFITKGVLRR